MKKHDELKLKCMVHPETDYIQLTYVGDNEIQIGVLEHTINSLLTSAINLNKKNIKRLIKFLEQVIK